MSFSHEQVKSVVVVANSDPFTPRVPESDLTGLVHIGSRDDNHVYVNPELAAEVATLRELGGFTLDVLYHTTNSDALDLIGRQKALFSSRSLLEAGLPIKTGEISQPVLGSYHRAVGGLEDVYASHRPNLSYAFESAASYPVVFGIDTKTLEVPNGSFSETSDGIVLGPKVPLTSVTSVITGYEHVPEIKDWTEVHCPEPTRVMSLEAAMLSATLR